MSRRIFETERARCHRFGDLGEDDGPGLTTLAKRFSWSDMLEATLWPSRTISDQYTGWRIETHDDVYSAMILEEDETGVSVLIPDLDRPVLVQKANVVDMRQSRISIMPESLLDDYPLRETSGLFRIPGGVPE